MAFDIEMIKNHYSKLKESVDSIRSIINRPLTSSEKILYSHLWSNEKKSF